MTTLSHHSTLGVILDSLLQSSNDQQFAFQDTNSSTTPSKKNKQTGAAAATTNQQQQTLSCKNYPLTLMPLATQIAGHGSEGDGQRAILKREDGRLLKPIQKPPKGHREAGFYLGINQSTADEVDQVIRAHIPRFFGIESVGFTNGVHVTEQFLVLEDITDGFSHPNIIDVKIGSQTWGPDASEGKIAQEKSKYLGTKIPFGFSILGMLVHAFDQPNNNNNSQKNPTSVVKKYDKSFGKELKQDQTQQVAEIYFNHDQKPPVELIEIAVEKISAILKVFEDQRKYKFYASSLLMAYDAQAVKKFKAKLISFEDLKMAVNVRVIDFAHVFEANGERDENFITGLTNFLDLFTCYLNRIK